MGPSKINYLSLRVIKPSIFFQPCNKIKLPFQYTKSVNCRLQVYSLLFVGVQTVVKNIQKLTPSTNTCRFIWWNSISTIPIYLNHDCHEGKGLSSDSCQWCRSLKKELVVKDQKLSMKPIIQCDGVIDCCITMINKP